MADTLTQLIAKVQAQLLDNATLFTTATCTAALRQALADLNKSVPQNATALITAVASQKEYELSDEEPLATGITDVLVNGDNEYDASLSYDAYNEDSRWFFRLRQPQAAGETLIVHYTLPHTINGLDGATDSTLPDDLNLAMINGGALYCCLWRAAGTIESNNVQPGVALNWMKLSESFQRMFDAALRRYKHQPTVKGEPTARAWNDDQHSTQYP
jgi:hypothetical protein